MNPSTRIPTVDDLRVKLCFICREEERFDNPQEPRRAWVHPCNCTLVAHESCLLQWIKAAQQDPARARNALKCPQCGATYELESDNPFILRLLDHVNASLSVAGKVVSAAGLAGIIVSFGFGIYIICTSYGAYAIQEFLGKEMYNILLTDDPSNWPWHAYMDLPLIPFSLIFSRTRFFDSLPFVPLLLAWPSSAPVASTTGVIAARWAPAVRAPPAPSHVIFTWPPSPIVVTMLFPILTAFYRRAYSRIKHQIMGTQPGMRPALREVVWDFGGDGPVPLRARIGVNVEPADHRRPQGGEQAQGEEEPDDPGHVAERTLRVTNASLGRFIGGALMMPAIANYMGAILYRLSKHFQLLRRFLAVRPPLQGPVPPPVDAWVDSQTFSKMGYLKQIGLGMRTALDLICGGTRSWQECDPVWWRNSIGLGIFLVAKDCVKLMHLYLAKRELETRRIKSRSFAGVDMRELDLVQRPDTPST
ncbi:uncharacterized protein LAESUDRAFT_814789 [Laetiporus sulphureus 93-53]|uniref:RING-CH-type domain-containing protein n=1 Tax=Laetiporus sulphureus 93-53 TaxID=1314785 RepID=A0A165CRN0_9APHY|nr:uncharacterized protein LAESUDRAFT_814789 [Laetiporus sulphureus 93-53]KZT03308.1 hypothetical protein LAESUDRAFT_814789 [Laetiporus sulphureus 93-53]